MPRDLLTAAQVARKLGRSLSWFQRNRATLEATKSFPRPVDGCGHRWDPAAIDAWLNRQLPSQRTEAAPDDVLLRRAQATIGEVQRLALLGATGQGAPAWPA